MTRLYFILSDENLFHPYYFLNTINALDKKTYRVVGVSVVKEKPKGGLFNFLNFQLNLWGLPGFLFIAASSIIRTFLGILFPKSSVSIENIAKKHRIPYYEVEKVNSGEYVNHIKKLKTDIIISSNGKIFKTELLKAPKIACINRHTALLPKYGGVLPVFWAMKKGEEEIGVTVHYMVEEVDRGDILSQIRIPINKNNSLFRNYIVGFVESVPATIQALDNVLAKRILMKNKMVKDGYFSFPKVSDLKNFRRKKNTFVFGDIYIYIKTLV